MAKTWKSFPIIVSSVKCYIQCSLVWWRLDSTPSLSVSLSPTPSTFSILFIFSKVKNVKEEKAVCLIALGHIPPSSAFLLFVWPTMWIQRTNICEAVCLSLKGSLYLNVGQHLKSHRQTEAKTRSPFIPQTCHSLVFRVI